MQNFTPVQLGKTRRLWMAVILAGGLASQALSQAGSPVTVCLQPDASLGNDLLLNSNAPATNYATHQDLDLAAWTVGGSPATLRSLLKFDQLASIPSNAIVQSATLSLYFNPTSSNGNGHSQLSGSNNGLGIRVTGPWNEMTTTWSTQPLTANPFSPYLADVVAVAASNSDTEDYEIDLSAMTQYWITNPADNHGMLFQLADENYYRRLLFASSDNADPTKWPKLCITYVVPVDGGYLCFQPDSGKGKDALLESLNPNLNRGNHPDNLATGWTVGGQIDTIRSLIQFVDLATITPGTPVLDAKLYLFNNPLSFNTSGQHSQLSGSNAAVLTRVTSPWDEHLVTWNNAPSTTSMLSSFSTDAVSVHASNYNNEHYEITVTDMVQHMVDNPTSDFGFQLQLVNEAHYRSLVFSSSDYSNSDLHPRLCVRVDTAVSVTPKLDAKARAKVYPNPAEHGFQVEIKANDALDAVLYDTQGQVVWRQSVGGMRTFFVDRQSLAAGIYHLQVHYSDQAASHHKVCLQ